MNELSEIDKALLETIKNNIEARAGLYSSENLSQKDFDFLQYFIEEATGEVLSLTTLKRIWKNEYQRLPHLSTLNMLSKLACDQDWHTVKKQFIESHTLGVNGKPSSPLTNRNAARSRHNAYRRLSNKFVAGVLLSLAGGVLLYFLPALVPGDTTDIQFSAVPTVDLRVPNSVVFSYDVTGYRADHFYIQQSWDPERKVEVFAANNKQTDIYYEPGYHYAKLMGDDRVLKEIPVHIRYNDWFVRVRYPDSRLVKVGEGDLAMEGYLGVTDEYAQRLRAEQQFQLGYMLSKDFGLSADELQLEAAIRFDSTNLAPCPTVNILIKGDKSYSWITLGNKGCESNLGLIVGSTQVDGKTNDLSSMGMEAFTWQNIGLRLSNGQYQLVINRVVAHEGEYSKNLGELKEVDFFFNGVGSIDEIRISDKDRSLISQSFN
ncbi:MAG TPA: hypothetical protein VF141_22850 [Chryseolinea sp.]